MFQKEVADRILAKCKSPNYGRLSIITRSRLQVVDSFNVTKNCFFPKPKVDSTVLIFEPLKKGESFPCFQSNKNADQVTIKKIIGNSDMFHSIFWPLLGMFSKLSYFLNFEHELYIPINKNDRYKRLKINWHDNCIYTNVTS